MKGPSPGEGGEGAEAEGPETGLSRPLAWRSQGPAWGDSRQDTRVGAQDSGEGRQQRPRRGHLL